MVRQGFLRMIGPFRQNTELQERLKSFLPSIMAAKGVQEDVLASVEEVEEDAQYIEMVRM